MSRLLVAVTALKHRVVASPQSRADGPLCPHCLQDLVVRLPRERVAHFAHRAHAGCEGAPAGRRRGRAQQQDAEEQQVRLGRRTRAEIIEGQGTLFDA